jgi:hypothetical protein
MGTYVQLDELVPISRAKAWWVTMFGPGDSPVNPLLGTRYDPLVRERVRAARRHAHHVRRHYRRLSPWQLREERGRGTALTQLAMQPADARRKDESTRTRAELSAPRRRAALEGTLTDRSYLRP